MGEHEKAPPPHPIIARCLSTLTRLVELDVLIAFLHLVVTCAAVFGLIHAHGGAP